MNDETMISQYSDNGDIGMSKHNDVSYRSCNGHTAGNGIGLEEIEPLMNNKQQQQQLPNGFANTNMSAKKAGTAMDGPDRVVEASSLTSCEAHVPVRLRMAGEGPLSVKPISIMTALKQTAREFPDHPALAFKESKTDKKWEMLTYSEYYEAVWQAAKSFIKLGLEPLHGVGILGFNSAEWFVADLACIFAGGLATGIYTTNSPDACRYVAASARCNVLVVENDTQLQKILEVWPRLPLLKAVVQYKGQLSRRYDNVYTWDEFIDLGDGISDDQLRERLAQQAPNKCCTLIFTSGTTGDPKGVMLSHDNLIWTARAAILRADLTRGREVVVTYLPLSHVAAQILDIYIPIMCAATVYFAHPDALKGSLVDTLKEARPTAFLGVPRVWEKIQERMKSAARQQWKIQLVIAKWAKSIGLAGNMSMMNGGSVPYGWTLANLLVFRKVRHALGLDRCRYCMTAAAPIMRDTLDFFMSLNLPLMEIYGMSETTGPHTISMPWKYRTVSVGTELAGSETRFSEDTGEVCMNGRNIFMGYLNMPDKTRETIDPEGWVLSGDVGRRDDGFVFITGRIKELLITAGGENVSPILIEDNIKLALPCVSNAMLIGDRRKFLSVLLTLKTEVDPDSNEPTSKLTRSTCDWLKERGVVMTTVEEALGDDKLGAVIQTGLDEVNRGAVSQAQRVQKFTILPRDFSIGQDTLGPTMKLKRAIVMNIYKDTIESMYA